MYFNKVASIRNEQLTITIPKLYGGWRIPLQHHTKVFSQKSDEIRAKMKKQQKEQWWSSEKKKHGGLG